MSRAVVFITLLALGPAAVSGCGQGDDAAALEAVEGYVGALRASDPEAVCSLLTQSELEDLEAAGSCLEVFTAGFELLEEKQVGIPEYEISGVVVDGDQAEATLTSDATNVVVPLAKEDGEWKLAGTTSLAEIHPDDPLSGGQH